MRHSDRPFLRLALIGALVASLGLAACGRKGPLDPPPGASLAGEQAGTGWRRTRASGTTGPCLDLTESRSRRVARINAFLSTFCSTERVMHHFAYRDGVLHAEAVNLDTLAAAVGTPFYCYSTATLDAPLPGVCRRLRRRARARLLRHEGKFQSGGRQDACQAWRRRRRGVGRRTQARAR